MQGEERETNKMQLIWCLLSNFCLNMFRASFLFLFQFICVHLIQVRAYCPLDIEHVIISVHNTRNTKLVVVQIDRNLQLSQHSFSIQSLWIYI